MLDHRKLLPLGTNLVTRDGIDIITTCVSSKHGNRVLPEVVRNRAGERFGVPDVCLRVNGGSYGDFYAPDAFARHNKHYEANIGGAHATPQPHCETVVIIGPGTIPEDDLTYLKNIGSDVCLITIGSAISFIKPKYHVVCDVVLNRNVKPHHFKEVIGVLSATCHPGWKSYPWKETTWYCNMPYDSKGLPSVRPSEGVLTDAITFAFETLQARRLVMVGINQPLNTEDNTHTYFWQGIFVQAWCYFWSRRGKEVWNCTSNSTILSGVLIGSLKLALRSVCKN